MAKVSEATRKKRLHKNDPAGRRGFRIPIATRLALSFLLIIVIISTIFTIVGIQLIGNRIVTEAQEKVSHDLNSAREIYQSQLRHINDVVRLTADRYYIKDALISGDVEKFADELVRVKKGEGFDILNITDTSGNVLLRANNLSLAGDNQTHNELVTAALSRHVPIYATTIISVEDLRIESPSLVEQAHFTFIDTPMARPRSESEQTSGMVLMAAAPIFDYQNNVIGILYGGVLLNRNYEIVDEIKRTVFQDLQYKGQDIGTATIFQDDVRISTNVKNEDGTRAVGTRIMEEVYDQVVIKGEPYIGRAYVVNNWYITAYEPIRDIDDQVIGILYVGILEQKYLDIKQQTVLAFLSIALIGVLVSTVLSYLLSRSISGPIKKLVLASKEVASGNLDTKVEITTTDELGKLAYTFNKMALSLRERDDKLKEFTRSKIMESERLALIGQLAANVAHELNNPLTGIITYSHLLLEQTKAEDPTKDFLQKIVNQADRCKEIIKGLLDFSRQKKPDITLCDVNSVLMDCISLVENQALFHNIQIQSSLNIDLPRVVIDPSQIERVFMNMIINAAEAIEGNGQLEIVSRFDRDKDCIEIEFTDTGLGIEKENLEKIFDPFFTTKDTGHGLGLAICYGIIKEHKGTILVESEVGKGTTFNIRLPVSLGEESGNNGNKV
jgi:two-component system NtrC family sensor kinase